MIPMADSQVKNDKFSQAKFVLLSPSFLKEGVLWEAKQMRTIGGLLQTWAGSTFLE